jgi:uncharacterized protein (DUF1800 family)
MAHPLVFRSRWLAAATGLAALASAVVAADQAAPKRRAPDARTVEHVLNRVAFGPRPGDIARVQAMGIDAYVEAQLRPERIDDSTLEARLAEMTTLTMSTKDLVEQYFRPAEEARRIAQAAQGTDNAPPNGAARPLAVVQAAAGQRQVNNELMQAKMLRAALSERQLQEVLTDFWFNHFNIFIGKGQVRQYVLEYERDVIRPRVLGNFRDLLGAVAHSPAMLFYLDNWQSSTPNAPALPREMLERINDPRLSPEQRRQLLQRIEMQRAERAAAQPRRPQRGINENYARELMELHTLGVDAGYTQKDVMELARILTGWTIDQPRNGGGFVFREAMHDAGSKTLLGTTFGSVGELEGEAALDLLARHPATAKHISFKLAQRFIADEPPSVVVERAAKVFTATKGDIREVVRTILTSPEFLDRKAYRAKVKTPLEFVVSAVRATGTEIVNAQPMVAAMQNLGMPLYGAQPPTGYSMTADAWVNTGALLNRMTFAAALVDGGRITPVPPPGRGAPPPGADPMMMEPAAGTPSAGQSQGAGQDRGRGQGRVQGPGLGQGRVQGQGQGPGQRGAGRGGRAGRGGQQGAPLRMDVATLAPDTTEASRDRLIETLLAGQVSDSTRQTLARAGTPQQLIALTLGSPEFQRR